MFTLSWRKNRFRAMFAVAVTLVAAVVAVVVLVAAGSGGDVYGLSAEKIKELKEIGVTPKQYTDAQKRSESWRERAEREPPPDPRVVAPRLIREGHEGELRAWLSVLERRTHRHVNEVWVMRMLSEQHTIVELTLVGAGGQILIGPGRWEINFALNRVPTPAEVEIANRPNAIEALNAPARQLGRFPKPKTGRNLSVELLAGEALSPGFHEVFVNISPAEAYDPLMLVRSGGLDEALLRGREIVAHPPLDLLDLKLAPDAIVIRQGYARGHASPKRRSSIYELSRLFNSGSALLILGWRKGGNLHELLHRPIQELTILSI